LSVKRRRRGAFEKTFKLIEDEVFSLHDIAWTVVTDDVAACRYEFRWKGLISGQGTEGGGRGTSILRRSMEDGSSRMSISDLMRGSREVWLSPLDSSEAAGTAAPHRVTSVR
jgi:hypothetical protein